MGKSFIHHPSSYRDPSGFIFMTEGTLYRQVNKVFAPDFDHFIQSGCYTKLVEKGLLLPHEQLNENLTGSNNWYTTLRPKRIPFLSFPYEWSFDMLKDAALLTLQLVRESVAAGLILKDATPYNIQWFQGRMIFIDTLSFAKYTETEPWVAYRQFCEQFLGPLLLMHYKKQHLHPMLLAWPEGIPLEIIRSLLPLRTKFSMHVYLHIHLHARVSAKNNAGSKTPARFSKQKLLNIITSLGILVKKLKLSPRKTNWSAYYDEASTRDNYLEPKKRMIGEWLDSIPGIETAADLGANDGEFARLLAKKNIDTIAADFDPYCINNLYNSIKKNDEKNIQPVIVDLANPSPSIGVNNEERESLTGRLHADLVIALALIHHLSIARNIPFEKTAQMLQKVCKNYLIIEFVPATDEKVQLMLAGKKDIMALYTEEGFRTAFEKYFRITRCQPIALSGRVLYLMKKNEQ